MSLSPDLKASYVAIIDGILGAGDLQTISAKQIRKRLQAALDHDIASQKDIIDELIVDRFDKAEAKQKNAVPAAPVAAVSKKAKKQNDASDSKAPLSKPFSKKRDLTELRDDAAPRKKVKSETAESGGVTDTGHDDAAFAARLQAEENSRARSTRGGGTVRRQKTGNPPKKKGKSATKVKADDDSDLESGSGQEKTVIRTGVFHKEYTLSAPLAELLGETSLSRPQTVKKIWEYVKGHDLQNPEDRRQIICDDSMKAVFKQDTVHMFTMNKILSNHLYNTDE